METRSKPNLLPGPSRGTGRADQVSPDWFARRTHHTDSALPWCWQGHLIPLPSAASAQVVPVVKAATSNMLQKVQVPFANPLHRKPSSPELRLSAVNSSKHNYI